MTCPQSQVGDSPAEVLASRQRVTLTAPKFPTEPSQKPLHTFADASSKRRPLDDACDLRKRHRTGSFVTVRPMTRRWISDVPPKIVNFSDVRFGHLRRAEDQGSELRSYLSSATVVVRRFQSASGAETEQRERSGLVWRTSPSSRGSATWFGDPHTFEAATAYPRRAISPWIRRCPMLGYRTPSEGPAS